MTIVYFSNFLNHHQKLFSEELVKLTNGNFVFIETEPMYDWLKKGGYSDYSNLDYVLCAWKSEKNKKKAIELAKIADVALFGGYTVLQYEVLRARCTDKISFDVSERWLKRGWVNLLSPRLIKSQWYYHTLFKNKKVYKLCSSAFGAGDQYKLHSFIDRCYKWGYFTKVDKDFDIKMSIEKDLISEITPIMWCSRFLMWKHPELPIFMAKELKSMGYRFHLDMYGSGEKLEESQKLVEDLGVSDVVSFKGNLPNEQILDAMREHYIFLFTSDQNEGWGAVANESMSNGCVLVGSDAIGATPFLVEDGVNGMLFKSAKITTGFKGGKLNLDNAALSSLVKKVIYLLDNPTRRKEIAVASYNTMRDTWSPETAAKNFYQLVTDLQEGRESSILTGPCSKALPI